MKWSSLLRGRADSPSNTAQVRYLKLGSVMMAAFFPLAFVGWQQSVEGTANQTANNQRPQRTDFVIKKEARTEAPSAQQSRSTVRVQQSSEATSDAKTTTERTSSVQINGRSVHLDDNGEIHKSIVEADGSTTDIDISSDGSSNTSSSSSSIDIQINSQNTP